MRSERSTAQIVVTDARPVGSTLELSLASCGAESIKTKVIEDRDAVTVTVSGQVRSGTDEQLGCSDGVTVTLRDPLGERRFIDGSKVVTPRRASPGARRAEPEAQVAMR